MKFRFGAHGLFGGNLPLTICFRVTGHPEVDRGRGLRYFRVADPPTRMRNLWSPIAYHEYAPVNLSRSCFPGSCFPLLISYHCSTEPPVGRQFSSAESAIR